MNPFRMTVTAQEADRVLARVALAWTAAGLLLAVVWPALAGALGLFAMPLWPGYAFIGLVLALLAAHHALTSASRAAGAAVAGGVPLVLAGLWYAAGPLNAAGPTVLGWLRVT